MTSPLDKLIEFQTKDLVTKFIKDKHNRKASDRAVREITSSFIQGREYFLSAEKADLTVRPLLLYYGVLAYSRGLILANNISVSESNLKPSHGLEIKNWQSCLVGMNFFDLEITLTDGTFNELLESTTNISYFRSWSNRRNFSIQGTIPARGTKVKLGELLRTFPDMATEFESWTNTKLIYAHVETFEDIGNGRFKIVLANSILPNDLEIMRL